MNHGVIQNLTNHGGLGTGLFGLFIVHHLLNMWFYKTAFKGRWNARRILLNVTDWVLFVLMILMGISSAGMSGLVFEWSPVQAGQGWRMLHLGSCAWGFMVMNFHLGLHTGPVLIKIEKKCHGWQKITYKILLFMMIAAVT